MIYAKLKVTEAAPTDGFAGEEVASIEVDHYLLLMPQLLDFQHFMNSQKVERSKASSPLHSLSSFSL